jgi:hypothetical protein
VNTYVLVEVQLYAACTLPKSVTIKQYTTTILPPVSIVCQTWSPALSKECRLRVFENRMLRKIFGPKSGEVIGKWRRLHNQKLHALYSLRNIVRVFISRRMRRMEHVTRIEKGEHTRFWWRNVREKDHLENLS